MTEQRAEEVSMCSRVLAGDNGNPRPSKADHKKLANLARGARLPCTWGGRLNGLLP